MIRVFCIAIFMSIACFAGNPRLAEGGPGSTRIALWNEHAPIGDGKYTNEDAWITVHRPAKPNGAAIVICPGGGYRMKMIGPEGHGIAEWLNKHGITGVVLDYRLPDGRAFVPLLDAQRAIRTVRAHAKEWELDPARIGIMGFSAGGHLASTADTHFDEGRPAAVDPIDRLSCRPDFAILVYPVITMGEHITHSGSQHNLMGKNPSPELVKLLSNEKQVTARTPPTFLRTRTTTKPFLRKTAEPFTRRSGPTRSPPNSSNFPAVATVSTATRARCGTSGSKRRCAGWRR